LLDLTTRDDLLGKEYVRGISLICGDGALRGGFIAGAVSRLLELYPTEVKNISNISASSASVAGMLYLLSHGEKHPGKQIWTQALSSSDFLRYSSPADILKKSPIYDVEYLTEKIFRRDNPLNIDSILNSPTAYYFPIYNVTKRRVEVFSNKWYNEADGSYPYSVKHIEGLDIYRLIQASNAAPYIYDRAVRIGDCEYVDAGAWVPHLLNFPGVRGTKKIVVVSRPNDATLGRLSYLIAGFVLPILLGAIGAKRLPLEVYFQYGRKPNALRNLAAEIQVLSTYDDIIVVRPNRKLGSTTDNTPRTLTANFMHGYEVIDNMKPNFDHFFGR